MRYRPGAHRSFRPRHRHWLRGLLLAVLVVLWGIGATLFRCKLRPVEEM